MRAAMPFVSLASAVACLACGDTPGTQPDAAVEPDARVRADHVEIVQVVTPAATAGSYLSIPIAPTLAGDMLVVGIAITGTATPGVRTVMTSQGEQFSRDDALWSLGCDHSFEQWSFPAVGDGVTSIDITLHENASVQAYAIEASGLSAFPLTTGQNSFSPVGGMQAPAYDAVVAADKGDLIVAQFTTCGTLTGLDPASAFTPLPAHDGAQVAYLVPNGPGMYAAHWLFEGDGWGQWTIVYH